MGGVRDLEEKKKRNNVYSSGSGGGVRGPSTVDKRNQELQCPHCERVFKQIQRFREHVAKQHADAAQTAGDEKSSRSAAEPEKVMDIGSKGGAWTKKSPKLLLLEWTQGQKRPKPRYKTLPEEGGMLRCKVVLPDSKDDQKDIVVFLEASQAAATEDAAQQAGALAALHHVGGERALHRILPQQYLPTWEWHGQQAERRRQQAAAREAAAEARKDREKAQRAAEARKKPSHVIMSETQRRMVESVLKNLREEQDGGSDGTATSAEDSVNVDVAAARLEALGFTRKDVAAAVATTQEGGRMTLPAALDWLCMRVPEEHLPPAFAAGSSGQVVGVIVPQGQAGARRQASGNATADLMTYGYRMEEAAAALQACTGDQEAAFARLYSCLIGADCATGSLVEPSEEWVEEQAALEAIYGVDAQLVSPRQTRLTLDDGRLTLDLRMAPGGLYPSTPLLIGVRSSGAPGWALLQLTKRLAAEAFALSGGPMAHDLALAAPDLLKAVLASPPLANGNASLAWRGDGYDAQTRGQAVQGETASGGVSASTVSEQGQQRPASRSDKPTGRHKSRRQAALDPVRETQRLLEEAKQSPGPKLRALQEARRKLPAFSRRADLLQVLHQHRVTVISGATGCGKSTQVPQYLLEDAISRGQGGSCNIICTQPRRISAVGLARRVSQERSEPVGGVVGYSVRFDTRTSARTRLLFCTTGILLRRLLSDPDLDGTTHVMVDEVHERSVDSDLLLLLLKRLLQRAANPGLTIVLMSATADAALFANYFSPAPQGEQAAGVLTIPGFTHPVQDFYLEDALELTQFAVGRNSRWAKRKGTAQGASNGLQASNSHRRQPDQPPTAAEDDDWESQADSNLLAHCTAAGSQAGSEYRRLTLQSLVNVDEALVNYELLEALICRIIVQQDHQTGPQEGSDGTGPTRESGASAILVFLPGAPEIARLVRTLQGSSALQRAAHGQQLRVLPLHGSLPPSQQARVFERAGQGVRKIVVATNVAETSITIDDVVCVIDSGRVKEMRYDSARGLSRLEETWVSRAAAVQRRGRAGRVQPGTCFKLFSRKQAASMSEHQAPEVLRVPLQQLCLTVKAALPGAPPIQATMAQLLTPPPPSAVATAVDHLTRMGALTSDEVLTPLGRHLSQMPMDAKLGKALIHGAMLRCLTPMLTIVAAMGYGRPIFGSPPDKRDEANAAKKQLTAASAAAKSDHLAIIAAFNTWNRARLKGGRHEAAMVSSQYFLSEAAMEGILSGRLDYAATLAELGFVPQSYLRDLESSQADAAAAGDLDEFSGNARIVKAALTAGFYPSILRVEHPAAEFVETLGGALEKDAAPVKLRFYDRVKGRVFMHPASVNFNVGRFESPWLLYTDLTETSKVYCREASMAPIYSLLLFGGQIRIDHEKSLLRLDGWASFKAPARIAVLVKELRAEVDKLLQLKFEDPSLDLSSSRAVDAMHRLLATDGF